MADEQVQTQLKSEQESTKYQEMNCDDIDLVNHESCKEQKLAFDILKLSKLKENSLIKLSNKNYNSHATDEKINCKILKLSSDLNLDDILLNNPKLNADEYPNLFIFIIHADDIEILDQNTQECSEKFKIFGNFLMAVFKNRPIVLQITSINENETKFYYKDENSGQFLTIDQQNNDFAIHKDFPTLFMMVLNGPIEVIEDLKADDLIEAKNSCLILKLLRTFQLSERFLVDLILSCGEIGTPDQLLAALDDPFESNGEMLSIEAQDYLSQSITFANDVELSVLLGAVDNYNKNIVKFLIEKFTYLIQQLPHSHKIDISSTALETNQIDVLCDLLKLSDFPFPKNFDSESVTNEELLQIVDERKKFHNAILSQDIKAIESFIDANQNSKLVFDIKNKSALSQALTSNSLEIFFQLKALGFLSADQENVAYEKLLEGVELEKAETAASRQMHKNVRSARQIRVKSVMTLLSKSTIFNKNLKPKTEVEYRKNMQQWFEDIYTTVIGSKLIDAAAQCRNVRAIFIFECNAASNINLNQISKESASEEHIWIIVDPESSKGSTKTIILKMVRELHHYVMRLVFENDRKPYYKNDTEACQKLSQVVAEVNKWTLQNSGIETKVIDDDECDGLISSVFTSIKKEDWHAELIARVSQILVIFDSDVGKLNQLLKRYKKLFDFHELYVAPKIMNLNLRNRKFNKIVGLLPEIENSGLELKHPEDLSSLDNNCIAIIISNVPKLFLVHIYNQSCAVAKKPFIDDQNIFITSAALLNSAIIEEYFFIQMENNGINIYVDHTIVSEHKAVDLKTLFANKSQKYILITRTKNQLQILMDELKKLENDVQEAEVNFVWIDLTLKSQKKFIKADLDFQKRSASLNGLMTKENFEQQEEKVATALADVVDDHLLNLFVEKSKISINIQFFEILSRDINFQLLFQFKTLTKELEDGLRMPQIPQKQLILNKENQTYVLISDIAGSGKSWALKSITKVIQEIFRTCWVTYVDLKQFISAFKSMTTKPNFLTFMLENVLKDHQKFEMKIFKKLYEIGKVFVLFDGFDEISPNYCEIVVKIIKSFESNGGNQMWIATRDYFEVDLKKHLGLDVAYKLDEFTEQDGIDLISSIWVLKEMESDLKAVIKPEDIKISPNFKSHQAQARKLMENHSKLQFRSIGFPQFYKMAAEVFKNGIADEHDLNIFNIYKQFAIIQIKRWSYEKGGLREDASIMAHTTTSNYVEVHQILAVKSLFPDADEICDLEYDEEEWPDVEIVGCGLVSKIDGTFLFAHETFREFFAADFILRNLESGNLNFFNCFIQFLTVQKHEVTRMFINDALADENFYRKISCNVERMADEFNRNVNSNENFSLLSKENLFHLSNLLIDLLRNCDHGKVKEIFNSNTRRILGNAPKDSKTFERFLEFMIEFLKADDLKDFMIKHDILQNMALSSLNAQVILDFLTKVDSKIAREILSLKGENGNFFLFLCSVKVTDAEKVKILFEALSTKYFSPSEMLDLLQQHDKNGMNILVICVISGNKDKLEFVWKKSEEIFASQNSTQTFKELAKQIDSAEGCNVLHYSAYCKNIDFHDSLWKLLLKTFDNQNDQHELKEMILQKEKFQDNYIHIVLRCGSDDIIKFILEKIYQNFNTAECKEIFMTKDNRRGSVLQTVIKSPKDVEIHRLLWKNLKKFSTADESFKRILKKVDVENKNIFHLTAERLTGEIFEFLIQQTENDLSSDEIKQLLRMKSRGKRNILQVAANRNKFEKLHEKLWKILNKIFDPIEMFQFVIHEDEDGRNMLEILVDGNTKEILKSTWGEIRKLLSADNLKWVELEEIFSQYDTLIENSWKTGNFDENSKKILKVKWREIIELLKINFNDSNEKSKKLMDLLKCQDINIYKAEFESLVKTSDDLILQNNFMHKLVMNNKIDFLKVTFEILKREKIRDPSIDLMEFFLNVDDGYYNIVQVAVSLSSDDIFKFLIQELEKIGTKEQIKRILGNLDSHEKNLLQTAVIHSESLQLHVSLWKTIREYFNNSEIFGLLTQPDDRGNIVIFSAVKETPQNILEMTFNEMSDIMSDADLKTIFEYKGDHLRSIFHFCALFGYEGILKIVWKRVEEFFKSQNLSQNFKQLLKQKDSIRDCNLLHYAASYCEVFKFHEMLWELLLKTFESKDELKELILQQTIYGESFVHFLVICKIPDIIDWTLNFFKAYFSIAELQEIISLKGNWGLSLLQFAIVYSKNIKNHQIFWKHLNDIFANDQNFKYFLYEIDDHKRNVFHYVVQYSPRDIYEFTTDEVLKALSREQMKNLLTDVDIEDNNLLHCAVVRNRSLELHEGLWETLQKYLGSTDILRLINQRNIDGDTMLLKGSRINTKEIVEFSWSKIRNFIDKADHAKYLMIKNNEENGLLELSHSNKRDQEVYKWIEIIMTNINRTGSAAIES